jgi:hypothetical protein
LHGLYSLRSGWCRRASGLVAAHERVAVLRASARRGMSTTHYRSSGAAASSVRKVMREQAAAGQSRWGRRRISIDSKGYRGHGAFPRVPARQARPSRKPIE